MLQSTGSQRVRHDLAIEQEEEEEEWLTLFPQSWSQIAEASATIINQRPCHRGGSLSQWMADTHLSLTQNMAICTYLGMCVDQCTIFLFVFTLGFSLQKFKSHSSVIHQVSTRRERSGSWEPFQVLLPSMYLVAPTLLIC